LPRRIESHWIAGPAGRLEALLEEPEDAAPRLAAVVCHPHPLYGGTMRNKVVHRIARGLRLAGAVALRFNFRGVGASAGSHGYLEGEIEDARAALAWLRARYPGLPFALAGFSFGARVITRLGCETEGARWLMAVGFPTGVPLSGPSGLQQRRPAGVFGPQESPAAGQSANPTTDFSAAHYLEACAAPKIFIQSTRDQYAPRPEMESLYARLSDPKRLIWIEAADHFFANALDELETRVAEAAI
jgi:alpha/beta superfamily hydrolase